ncbi:MAG TPA: cytochrome P450 [Myxococcota bacterium]|jgi:cytochrome P450
MTGISFDPMRAEMRANPYPAYAELRRHSPVHRIASSGVYVLSRYADVLFTLRRPDLFSSSAMKAMMMGGFTGGGNLGMGFSGAEAARLGALLQQMPIKLPEFIASRSLIAADPPVHGPMRSLVNRGFTPRRIAALEPRIREIARGALAAVEEKGEFDLVEDLAIPLPVTVIAEMLGVEAERHADFKHWSDCIISGITGTAEGMRPETLLQAFAELSEYVARVVEERRAQPREDLISTMILAGEGETALTPVEAMGFTLLLLVAGNETTTNLLGNSMLALLDHPDQLARVQQDPSLVPALVEETLRYDPPAQFVYRTATRDVELAGTRIPAGSTVMVLLASANRDDAQFPDGERFDVARNPQGHLGFGVGIHFCLGASLARLEARVTLEELLTRFEEFERVDPAVEYIDSVLVRGPRRLPLRFEPA